MRLINRIALAMLFVPALSCATLFAQENNNQISPNKLTVRKIKYPEYIDTGNPKYDNLMFKKAVLSFVTKDRLFPNLEISANPNADLERWNKDNLDVAGDLEIGTYADYLSLKKELKIIDYPLIPEKVSTGNAKADEMVNKQNLKEWMEHHPDYPPYTEDVEVLRKARLAFYNKYIKED